MEPASKKIRGTQRSFFAKHKQEPAKVGCTINDLRTPCLIINVEKATANAKRMAARAKKMGCKLRPHVKTHKTLEGAELQTNGTKRSIVVSTLSEARFFGGKLSRSGTQ
jgi:D-serine deaminase-like pyridoxal phosphate-dependent protein